MHRLAWSQLRFRTSRTVALLAGLLIATTAFTVLTAASRTSQLRTVGTVTAHFQPAYDILVRPKGSRTALEAQTGTVQPNFLSGIYGGITLAQYRQIQQIPGVQVAAPVAMVGYVLLRASIPVLLPAADNARPGRQLYRYSTTWVSAGGTTRIAQPASYLYLTPDRLGLSKAGANYEVLPGGSRVTVCPPPGGAASPFSVAAQSSPWCWSKINGTAGAFTSDEPKHRAFATVNWFFPMLIAAVDPDSEARLDGLGHALASGRFLSGKASGRAASSPQQTVPVLAAASSGIGEYAVTRVQQLAAPAGPVTLSASRMSSAAAAPGRTVLTTRISAQQAYQQVIKESAGEFARQSWTAGPASYRLNSDGSRTPIPAQNPVSLWRSPEEVSQLLEPPMDETDSQYRKLQVHGVSAGSPGNEVSVHVVGTFNAARVRSFDPLSQVPLGMYQPVAAAPADAASRKALGGHDLLPSLNLGGYVSQPAQLVTTLASLPALHDSGLFGGDQQAPLSVVRVRVAGVTGPGPESLERIREVAQQIAVRTGLDVDIVAGSSPAPTVIDLPAGKFGQPALRLTEGWVKKGVAVAILTAVDKESVLLFTLILLVCVLFVANSATAAIRGRRRELGVLACLGWTGPRLFTAVLGNSR